MKLNCLSKALSFLQIMHQSIPAVPSTPSPPPAPATTVHLPTLSVSTVGHLQILCSRGAGHLPTPGPFLSFWHARGFLSWYNYTEDFTGKTSRLAHLSRTRKNWRGLKRHVLDFMHAFLHCLSSQNYIAKLELSMWINVFWLLNQISVDIIWRTSFHIYKTIHNI